MRILELRVSSAVNSWCSCTRGVTVLSFRVCLLPCTGSARVQRIVLVGKQYGTKDFRCVDFQKILPGIFFAHQDSFQSSHFKSATSGYGLGLHRCVGVATPRICTLVLHSNLIPRSYVFMSWIS